ncbi:MFS transporter [Candidatus Dojkabacteria bacterium]|nr:MFS transporter [Candidatus Dojkabacteria bacterium]
MSKLFRVKLVCLLGSSLFWISISLLYWKSRGIDYDLGYKLLSLYSIAIVLLEYPTGVIGDHFSHRLSVIFGFSLNAVSMFLISLSGPTGFYIVALILLALGQSLITGSITALLYSVSGNFKKDNADIGFWTVIWGMLSTAVGGFLADVDLRIPIWLSSVAFAVGVPILLSLNVESNKKIQGNIFSRAVVGVKSIYSDKKLLSLTLLYGLLGGLFLSYKWLYNPIFDEMGLKVVWWGILAGFATFLVAVGSKVYPRLPKFGSMFIVLMVVISSVMMSIFGIPVIVILGLMGGHFMRGLSSTFFEYEINTRVKDTVRASVISFQSLLSRLASSGMLLGIGFVLDNYGVGIVGICIAVVLGSLGLVFAFWDRTNDKTV